MTNLADIFLRASAKKDDSVADIVKQVEQEQQAIWDTFDNLLLNIQFLLQARLNQKTGMTLSQLKSKDITVNIKSSLVDKIEELKVLAAEKFKFFFEYFSDVTFKLTKHIDEQAWNAVVAVQDYNLALDFERRMVHYLKDLDIGRLDPVLKLLILSHVKKRLERSVGL